VIAIASTSYNSREAEERTIAAIVDADTATPLVTLDKPLKYKHFAATETFGTQQIDMRAEVGLLTRSVVYKGDDDHTVDN
jgi:cell migration-inducing and hyaluronan-binding protein